MRFGFTSASVAAAASVFVGSCAGAPLPQLPDVTGNLFKSDIVGAPTDVYARVARGAMACWFGTGGPLKAQYIYHAQARPASQGGTAEIVIHEIDRTSENPRGLRAYRIVIKPSGDVSALAIENLKLPEPLAASMKKDVHRWAAGAIGCTEADGGWGTQVPATPKSPKQKPGRTDRAT
jgi:hypothetical protein